MQPRSVLIIDDEPAIGAALAVRLRAAGYDTRSATSGIAGLESARRDAPDAIVLDIRMPGMDGIAVSTRLRAEPATAHVPIVFLSASTLSPSMLSSVRTLGDAFLPKPYDPTELLGLLATFTTAAPRAAATNPKENP